MFQFLTLNDLSLGAWCCNADVLLGPLAPALGLFARQRAVRGRAAGPGGRTVRVVQYKRRPAGGFSVERVFADVRAALPADIAVCVVRSSFASHGVFPRLYNLVEAAWRQAEVNHVTGDVHYLTLLLRRRKTVLTILDTVSLERLHGWRYWVIWFLWYWLPMRRAGIVTLISESTRADLLRHGLRDAARALIVPCAVSSAFTPSPADFDRDCPRLLQVGTKPNKNLERVAAALAGIRCRLVVIGPLTAAQWAVLHAHGIAIEQREGLTDAALIEEYRRADLVIFASTYEGFGLPILESQAIGRPVVTSQCSAMPEVAGAGACLVDPFDVTSIRMGILRVIEDADYRASLVAAGWRNVARFSYTSVAARYAEIYVGLAQHGPEFLTAR